MDCDTRVSPTVPSGMTRAITTTVPARLESRTALGYTGTGTTSESRNQTIGSALTNRPVDGSEKRSTWNRPCLSYFTRTPFPCGASMVTPTRGAFIAFERSIAERDVSPEIGNGTTVVRSSIGEPGVISGPGVRLMSVGCPASSLSWGVDPDAVTGVGAGSFFAARMNPGTS